MSLEIVLDTPTLTASEVMAASGITYRMLDYWTRCGHLKPAGKAHPGYGVNRKYPEPEAEIAAYALRLITAGFTTHIALTYARQLVEGGEPIELADGLLVIWPDTP